VAKQNGKAITPQELIAGMSDKAKAEMLLKLMSEATPKTATSGETKYDYSEVAITGKVNGKTFSLPLQEVKKRTLNRVIFEVPEEHDVLVSRKGLYFRISSKLLDHAPKSS